MRRYKHPIKYNNLHEIDAVSIMHNTTICAKILLVNEVQQVEYSSMHCGYRKLLELFSKLFAKMLCMVCI